MKKIRKRKESEGDERTRKWEEAQKNEVEEDSNIAVNNNLRRWKERGEIDKQIKGERLTDDTWQST